MALPLVGTGGGCGKSVSSTGEAGEMDMAGTCVSTEWRTVFQLNGGDDGFHFSQTKCAKINIVYGLVDQDIYTHSRLGNSPQTNMVLP